MVKCGNKLIMSLLLVLTLFCGISISSSADLLGGAGLLGSGLSAVGVDLLAGGSATAGALAPWLNGEYSIIGSLTGVADGYIKVNDDSVFIDGVEYQSIFLDSSMAQELHTQIFDFATQKAISSNSSGILASGVGYADGIPLYSVNGEITSQEYSVTYPNSYQFGGITLSGTLRSGTIIDLYISDSRGTHKTNSTTKATLDGRNNFFSVRGLAMSSLTAGSRYYDGGTVRNSVYINVSQQVVVNSPFNYSYVSQTIDADPLPQDYGFQVFVPVNAVSYAGITPGTYVIDGGSGTDTVIQLIELLDQLYGQQAILNPEFAQEVVPPAPIPDYTLGELPYEDFIDTFGQSVYSKLDTINQSVDTLGGIIEGQGEDIITAVDTAGQSVLDGLSDVEGAIDTVGQSVVDGLTDVEGAIETGTAEVVESVDAVAEAVDALEGTLEAVHESILSHPLDLFSAFLDRLTNIPVLRDFFDNIKRHVGIWHYVVEWLQCIGTFLSFFIGLFADVAYCMVVPIYACVAGSICLALYKRFGR